jgi:hypothetical protein
MEDPPDSHKEEFAVVKLASRRIGAAALTTRREQEAALASEPLASAPLADEPLADEP